MKSASSWQSDRSRNALDAVTYRILVTLVGEPCACRGGLFGDLACFKLHPVRYKCFSLVGLVSHLLYFLSHLTDAASTKCVLKPASTGQCWNLLYPIIDSSSRDQLVETQKDCLMEWRRRGIDFCASMSNPHIMWVTLLLSLFKFNTGHCWN